MLNAILLAVSDMANMGIFNKHWTRILVDFDFIYHAGHVLAIVLGLVVHEFFYSLLVSRDIFAL